MKRAKYHRVSYLHTPSFWREGGGGREGGRGRRRTYQPHSDWNWIKPSKLTPLAMKLLEEERKKGREEYNWWNSTIPHLILIRFSAIFLLDIFLLMGSVHFSDDLISDASTGSIHLHDLSFFHSSILSSFSRIGEGGEGEGEANTTSEGRATPLLLTQALRNHSPMSSFFLFSLFALDIYLHISLNWSLLSWSLLLLSVLWVLAVTNSIGLDRVGLLPINAVACYTAITFIQGGGGGRRVALHFHIRHIHQLRFSALRCRLMSSDSTAPGLIRCFAANSSFET